MVPQYVFGGQDVEDRSSGFGRLILNGTPISVYADSTALLPLDDVLVDLAEVPLVGGVAVDVYSQIPLFGTVADDLDTLYVSVNDGPVVPIYARSDDRIDALVLRVDTLEDDLSGHATDFANPHVVTKAQIGLSGVPDVEAWQALVGGAAKFDYNSSMIPKYRLVGDRVDLKGRITVTGGAGFASGEVVAIMPLGYRPAVVTTRRFGVQGSGSPQTLIITSSNGEITTAGAAGAATFLDIDQGVYYLS